MPAENDTNSHSVNTCCICLERNANTWKLSSCQDTDKESCIFKLKECVGEREWSEEESICAECVKLLNSAYKFRQLCLRSAKIEHKEAGAIENDDISNEYKIVEYDDPEREICKKSPVLGTNEDSEVHSCEIRSLKFESNANQHDNHSTEEHSELSNYEEFSNDCDYNVEDPELCNDKKSKIKRKNVSKKSRTKKPIKSLGRDFSCDLCTLGCKNATELIHHSVTVHKLDKKDVKTYTCPKCTNKFRLASSLLQHLSYHDGSRDQICTTCGKGFMTRSDLISHEKIHSDEFKYKCSDCDRTFKTHPNLRTHRMLKHTDRNTWPHGCDVCGKRFLMKSGYNAHMRIHNNERPFSCHLCGKSFIENGVLLKHLRTHSNVRAFKCSQCEKEYKDKHNMKIHMVREHNIGNIKVPKYNTTKRFFCHLCPKGFVEKSKLTRHLNSHTGERPFACSVCGKRFTDKSYIRPHMKTVHNSLLE